METTSRKKPLLIGAIIFAVLIIVGVASYFYLSGPRAPQYIDDPQNVASLTFQFDEVTATPGEHVDLDIYLESDISVTQADISVLYDSEALILQDIQPTINNFMGLPTEYEIIENTVDSEEEIGIFRIRAYEGNEPPTSTRQGKGVIARLRFVVQPTYSGATPVVIFKDSDVPRLTSQVFKANSGDSILGNAGSLTIKVQ